MCGASPVVPWQPQVEGWSGLIGKTFSTLIGCLGVMARSCENRCSKVHAVPRTHYCGAVNKDYRLPVHGWLEIKGGCVSAAGVSAAALLIPFPVSCICRCTRRWQEYPVTYAKKDNTLFSGQNNRSI